MLNLSNNKIKKIEGINHLNNLFSLDMSNNEIETLDSTDDLPTLSRWNPCAQFPRNLVNLRMNENPVEKEDKDYRKKLVCALENLLELDKIKVVAAERLIYRGLLPNSTFKID
jgi:Leucine-rich repeat (LRR) protein